MNALRVVLLIAVLTSSGCSWLWKHVVCPLDNGCQSVGIQGTAPAKET